MAGAVAIGAPALLAALRARGLRVATGESCTGGLIVAALTEVPGSSDVVLGGLVTYSNALKTSLLGVPSPLLAQCGAVSQEVAEAMAIGVIEATGADLAVAVTGVAGPGGGSPGKPVGTVWLAAAASGKLASRHCLFPGDRAAVRAATVAEALDLMAELCGAR